MRAGRLYTVGESQTPPCNPAHHRTDGNAQDLGDLFVRETIDTDEHQDRPLFLRQIAKLAVDIVQGEPRLRPPDTVVTDRVGCRFDRGLGRFRTDLRSSAQVFWMMR
jgi:hypothetical protein